MLTTSKKILNKANKGRYAVGAFNINNMEILQAVVNAASKLKAPVIIQTTEGAIKYAGLNYLYSMAKTIENKITFSLHLDHGKNISLIKKCIRKGYTSVMFDGSDLPYEKNLKLTKKVVKLASRKNVSVEAELGTIGGKEDKVKAKIIYTDPEQAKHFVRETGIDALAIAIGTSHGAYKFKGKPSLRFDILKEIKGNVKIPLVLHGASEVSKFLLRDLRKYKAKVSGKGVPPQQIKKAIKLGINKINVDTDIRLAFDLGVRKTIFLKPREFDPRKILGPARKEMQKVVEDKIILFGSKGK